MTTGLADTASSRADKYRSAGLFMLVLLFFFVSGACGLLYQVVWTRKLVLLFGTTSYAVGTVLSIFFLGLGVGSLWGGRLADRTRRPLHLYGLFEIIIGAWALVFILLVNEGESVVVALLRFAGASRGVGVALRGLLALGFLIVPVTLMGATLPLLSRFVGRQSALRGFRIGSLYSVNTFGAVAGCAFTGFMLLAALGYTRTTLVGAVANALVGLLAVLLSRMLKERHADPTATQPSKEETLSPSRPGEAVPDSVVRLVVAAFGVSGFCFLALEVLWTRMLAIVFLGTTYAFTTMLTSLLCGIAAGSAFASVVVDRRRHPVAMLGAVILLIGVSCIAMLAVFAELPATLARLQLEAGYEWGELIRLKFLLSFAVLFVPTFLSGMTFPIVVRAATGPGSRLGRDIGKLYSANTFGGVLGSLAGGFLLIPLLGTQTGIIALSLVMAILGTMLVLSCPTLGRAGKGSALAALIVAAGGAAWVFRSKIVGLPDLLGKLPAVGIYFHLFRTPTGAAAAALLAFLCIMALLFTTRALGTLRKAGILAAGLAGLAAVLAMAPLDVGLRLTEGYLPRGNKGEVIHEVIFYQEGVEGTVVVSQPKGDDSGTGRVLFVNGVQATASIEKGVKMNRLQGVLPLVFDRDPRKVLFMCFGSGITAGTIGLSDFERIDAVEISHEVLEAAPKFAIDNLNIVENPKVNFVVDDGRNFLLTTTNEYDLITFEPMPLALAGVSTFYTREYYELCLDRLAPGGMVSQWVPLHGLNAEVCRSLTRTFTEVFPEYCGWFINADLFLVGSNQPLRIDYARARERLSVPQVRQALNKVGFKDLPEFLTCFFLSKQGVDAFGQGRIMTDDRPWAEFEAPKLVYAGQNSIAESLRQLKPLYESPVKYTIFEGLTPDEAARARKALDRRYRAKVHDLDGLELYYGGMVGGEQEEHFKRALEIDPHDYNARYYLRQIASQRVTRFTGWSELDKAEAYLLDLLEYMPNEPDIVLMFADVLAANGKPEEADRQYRRYIELGGDPARVYSATQADE